MNINRIIKQIISIPKTLYFNLKMFPLNMAIKLPVLVGYNVSFGKLARGRMCLENWSKEHYRVIIGLGGSPHITSNKNGYLSCGKDALITFKGPATFAEGSSLRVDHGDIQFGANFSTNKNCCFNCERRMTFGDNVLFGWNINVRDTDGHQVYVDGEPRQLQKDVIIGDHVWIGSYSDILKGAVIGKDSVIAWRSLVLKAYPENNILVGGTPAKILQSNVNWRK